MGAKTKPRGADRPGPAGTRGRPFLDPGRPVQQAHYECEARPEPPSRNLPWLTGDVDVPPTLTVSVTGDPAPRTRAGSTWPASWAEAC
jgi:hypothetical protein